MQLLDITKFDTDFDFLSKAKLDIENKWIKEKIISENQSFTDFIKRINVAKYILMVDTEHAIPFNFILTDECSYVFYCGTGDESIDSKGSKYIAGVIHKTDYNIYQLKEITSADLAVNEKITPDVPYFIIDGKNYVFND